MTRFDATSAELDDPRLAAAVRAGAAGRRLVLALIASGAPTETLDVTATELDRLADALEPHAVTSRYADREGSRSSGSAIPRWPRTIPCSARPTRSRRRSSPRPVTTAG